MKKIQNLQALRGVAVLLVVIFHLVVIEAKYGGAQTILPQFLKFGGFGVDLFFVISGFVMVAVTRGQFQNNLHALRFIYHRISRIFPIYWLYTLMVLVVFLINPLLINNSIGNQADIAASFFLLSSDKPLLLNIGWTLVHEMYFYQMFFFIMLLVAEKNLAKAILVWGLVVIVINLTVVPFHPLIKLVTHPLTLEFIAGSYIAIFFYKFNDRILGGTQSLVLAAIVLVNSIVGYALYLGVTGIYEPEDWWRILIFGVPAILIVAGLISAERNGYFLPRFLIKTGNASYSIYLTHVLTLSAVGRIWQVLASDSVYDNLFMIPVLFLLVLIVGFSSYQFIERPLLKMSRKIIE